jgi:hypothetical protein
MNPDLKAARERAMRELLSYEGTFPGYVSIPTEHLRTILAALDEQEWRPIETAPRDGTKFDIWSVREWWQGREVDCWIAGDDYPQWRGRVVSTDPIRGDTGPEDDATHWRPLPAPPVEVKGP